ncbi:NAD(P)/FAD-dependent oxidoreductase [Verminephrobacter eiseniae]|uniref:NAD(P)/FAD-dependent oxidoreductase n=1 Tax=Verminephrobacter eiseniae TaxID=364317 RepID=UPI002239052E|nr:FAD-dependent oxidoreductase [Verminephrobacter eiseniae]MCW5232809.1 FAD-dependent oxidoreductase [Verminephrobacter eiseniae]MCW5295627.1 FAD-dependent oxidoreductase [Verminephrobacter eiseniae]MCW8184755.1 FAD-dependent oxidoreductase [Verminephrobacter eiseniae]MCW8221745.1 FAD-dependent oxidoreductase [Verminephrobacter eiseniae]MCW8232566.1 FAD-dependent oxidoreductase [Verminephrobacter eiseniae]
MSISPPAPRLRRNTPAGTTPRHFAIVGAGMAGITCARTLAQAGHEVTVFEKSAEAGGRTATIDTPFGSFDAGAQYFTVRDPRFAQAVDMLPGLCRRWSANAVQMLDAAGRVTASGLPRREAHWVASPGMQSLLARWAEPLRQADRLMTGARVTRIEPEHDPSRAPAHPRWKLRTEGPDGSRQSHAGFHAVLLAQPPLPAQALLQNAGRSSFLSDALEPVTTAPCWTLMLAYPQAVRPGLTTLGPQWNAARSTHHRIAWLARESSKPGRQVIERWTVQASPVWSAEHLEDDPARVQAKLIKAFAEVTGIRAEPAHADTRRWRHAQTTRPLGRSHLWDADLRLGVCGDWCLGHRLEDAFVSGLELALAVA